MQWHTCLHTQKRSSCAKLETIVYIYMWDLKDGGEDEDKEGGGRGREIKRGKKRRPEKALWDNVGHLLQSTILYPISALQGNSQQRNAFIIL